MVPLGTFRGKMAQIATRRITTVPAVNNRLTWPSATAGSRPIGLLAHAGTTVLAFGAGVTLVWALAIAWAAVAAVRWAIGA